MANFETPPCGFCNNGHNNVLPLSLQLIGMTLAAPTFSVSDPPCKNVVHRACAHRHRLRCCLHATHPTLSQTA